MLNERTSSRVTMSAHRLRLTLPALLVVLSCWFQMSPAAASYTIELQFSDNLGSNIGDHLDILITTANVPGAYPSGGQLITNITGTGALTFTFPGFGSFQYP